MVGKRRENGIQVNQNNRQTMRGTAVDQVPGNTVMIRRVKQSLGAEVLTGLGAEALGTNLGVKALTNPGVEAHIMLEAESLTILGKEVLTGQGAEALSTNLGVKALTNPGVEAHIKLGAESLTTLGIGALTGPHTFLAAEAQTGLLEQEVNLRAEAHIGLGAEVLHQILKEKGDRVTETVPG